MTRAVLAAGVLLAGALLPAQAATGPTPEQLRAVIVFNMTRFVSWSQREPNVPMRLCISDDADLRDALFAISELKKSDSSVEAVLIDSSNPGACDLAYLSDRDVTSDLPERLMAEGVVTIASVDGFARKGVIGLVRVGRQHRFEINNTLAKQSGVVLSSRVLQIATRVY